LLSPLFFSGLCAIICMKRYCFADLAPILFHHLSSTTITTKSF
jgi:hypothetical protein